MPKTPEGKVKDDVKKILEALNAYSFMPYMAGMGRAGIPDFVCCIKGRFVAIECKSGLNEPTALQRKELRAIKESGGITLVVNEGSIRGLYEFLQNIQEAKK